LPLHCSRRFYLIPQPLYNTPCFVALDIRKEQGDKAMISISNSEFPQQLCLKQWRMTLDLSVTASAKSKCCGCKWSENTSLQTGIDIITEHMVPKLNKGRWSS